MTKKQTMEGKRLQQASLRATRLGFVFIAIYVMSIIIYKAWKLLTPDALQNRWTIAAVALGVNLALWWFSRKPRLAPLYYQGIIFFQILMYISVATLSIYSERGMASNAIILFAIPLVIVALSHSGKALFGTALLCSAAYSGAAIKYFREFPSEGYKVELYGGIVFYSAILFLIAALLWVVVRSKNSRA